MNGAAHVATGRTALMRGDFATVRRVASELIAQLPEEAEGHFLRGIAEAASGQIRVAIAHLERAIALRPSGEYRAQLAKLYVLVRRDGDAAALLHDAEQSLPSDALSRDTIDCVYARLGDHAAALPHFTAAVRLAPHQRDYRYNHATTLSFLGRIAEAETAIEQLLAQAPDEARAHHLLAGLRKQDDATQHVARLTAAHARATPGRDRLLLGYALAKELEDIGAVDPAFARLCAVNAEHRAALPYAFSRDAAIFDAIEAHWPSIGQAAVTDPPDAAPIFIIGMPRTGTTLVDRILSSHPAVESAGELQAMPLAVKQAAGTPSRVVLDTATIAAASTADLGAIGHAYLARAQHHRRDPMRRFTDKFPGNFHYAGMLARALPQASIVCLRRHPLDTVLSNFRNLFAISSPYYDYSYDLADIAAYYIRFDRLMAFWQRVLPGRILELRYEDLVANQAGETRRLLAHCGLDWSDACLSFHTNAAPVSTPSAAQVRRPIYADSVARWKRHAGALAPIRAQLEAVGITID